MFESLKKKFASWLGKAKEEKPKKKAKPGKKPKKPAKKAKKTVKKSEKTEKIPEKLPKLPKGAKEIYIPKKFNVGYKIYEPETEKIPKQIKEIEETEEKLEEAEEELSGEKQGFFSKIIKKLTTAKLDKDTFEDLFSEFEITLLENNVALEVVDKIRDSLAENLVGKHLKEAEAEKQVFESLKSSILEVLIEPSDLIKQIKKHKGLYTIIFFGINGSGKTTSIAKLAHLLQKNNISCVLAAADTFRAASIEQLQKHGDKLKVKVIKHDYGSDPAAVAFDAQKYAEKNKIQVVLIDTAGRMYTKSDLLREMEKIIRVSQPDLKIFVGESITGNDATEQAKTFNEAVGIDGIVLSKADIDEKAGTILSVSYVTKKPIYYLGIGQNYPDLKPFTKNEVLKNLGLE